MKGDRGEGGGVVLSFWLTREAGTRGGDRGRQKLGLPGGFGQFLFRVYTKRVQEHKTNMVTRAMYANTVAGVIRCAGFQEGQARGEEKWDWIREVANGGGGRTGIEDLSLWRWMLGSNGSSSLSSRRAVAVVVAVVVVVMVVAEVAGGHSSVPSKRPSLWPRYNAKKIIHTWHSPAAVSRVITNKIFQQEKIFTCL